MILLSKEIISARNEWWLPWSAFPKKEFTSHLICSRKDASAA